MQSDASVRAYIGEVDLIRAFAIIGVLTVHTTALTVVTLDPQSTLYGLYDLLNVAFKYGTPTFIFLSSFVLFLGYMNKPVDSTLLKHFYRRRLLYIVLPYLIFSFVYITVKQYFYYGFGGWAEWWTDFIYRVVTGNAHAHLYFIIISIQFYAMFPWLLKLFQSVPFVVRHAYWLGFAVQWVFILLNKYLLHVPDKGSLAFSYFSVYLLGAYFGIHYLKLRAVLLSGKTKTVPWLIAVWLFGLAGHFGLIHANRVYGTVVHGLWYQLAWNIHTASTALLLFYAAHRIGGKIPGKLSSVLQRLGQASFGIYLVHPLLLIAYETYVRFAAPLFYHSSILLKWLFLLIGSYALVRVTGFVLKGLAPYVLGVTVRR